MKSRDFCYWLQGFFELTGGHADRGLSGEQAQAIQRHLALVFKHDIDPQASVEMPPGLGNISPEQYQDMLNAIHTGQPICQPTKIGSTGPDGEIYRC